MDTVYRKALCADFDALAPLVQRFHAESDTPWNGMAQVRWSHRQLVRALLWLARLPKEAERTPLTVRVLAKGNGEIWQRQFGRQKMVSAQRLRDRTLYERFGPIALLLENRVHEGALHQMCYRSSLLGMSLPRVLRIEIAAREWEADGRFNFSVEISLARFPLIRYHGWLSPQNGA